MALAIAFLVISRDSLNLLCDVVERYCQDKVVDLVKMRVIDVNNEILVNKRVEKGE